MERPRREGVLRFLSSRGSYHCECDERVTTDDCVSVMSEKVATVYWLASFQSSSPPPPLPFSFWRLARSGGVGSHTSLWAAIFPVEIRGAAVGTWRLEHHRQDRGSGRYPISIAAFGLDWDGVGSGGGALP
ncbi:hypothetical protein GUJ93_ZPchr0006g43551 [Zizania palustris]|uniref:Uncharacterized protein n=1 Tax=Zizania palustris TaxID=103762 RepID=A0A8J5VLT2_ZIZPA|nr:hypothetical protein GUJ93_ZPchr0006g43551 [Zizania palustris]